MKKHRLLLLLWIAFFSHLLGAQEKTAFLFEEYQDAVVHFKGLLQSKEKVNYNRVSNTFYFIDKKDGRIKELSQTDNIFLIKIGNRDFIPAGEGMQEILPTTPLIYVQYKAKGAPATPKGAYGMAQEGASVSTYSEFRDGGTRTVLKDNELEAKEYYNYYWIEKNDKKRVFKSFKQFLKIYPKHKSVLETYIKEENIDFLDVKAIVSLCLYAESL